MHWGMRHIRYKRFFVERKIAVGWCFGVFLVEAKLNTLDTLWMEAGQIVVN